VVPDRAAAADLGVLVEVDDGTAGLSHETSRLQRVRSEI
jgi:hypothetical protein